MFCIASLRESYTFSAITVAILHETIVFCVSKIVSILNSEMFMLSCDGKSKLNKSLNLDTVGRLGKDCMESRRGLDVAVFSERTTKYPLVHL